MNISILLIILSVIILVSCLLSRVNINKYIEGEEIILIKGSRSINLEKVAEALGVTNAL